MRISNYCYAVTGLGYSTPWCVNAGFVAGEAVTLIVDTGANALAAATIHGYAVAAGPGNELRVVNTEKHFDHIGGNSFFRDRGIDVWGHAAIERTPAEFEAEIREFNDGIGNGARRHRMEANVFFSGTALAIPNRKLQSEMQFDLGGCSVELLPTPGHTETNISVWVPEDRVLFSGDCLIGGYLPNLDASGPAGWAVWLRSLAKIEALQPSVVVPGHGPVAERAEVTRMIETVRATLREAIEKGHSPTMPRSHGPIREAREGDAEAIAELTGQLGYAVTAEEMRLRLRARRGDAFRDQTVFVAIVEGMVTGWIDVAIVHHLQSGAYGEICGLVVSSRFRSSGIGKQLVARAEAFVRERGLDRMVVRSRITREAAHRFYLREGYELTKTSAVFSKLL